MRIDFLPIPTRPHSRDAPVRWDFDALATEGPRPDGRPALSMACLGRLGRWGNSVMQYAFLRVLAERYGRRTETPAWLGQYLLDVHDKPILRRHLHVVLDRMSEIHDVKSQFWRAADGHIERAQRHHCKGRVPMAVVEGTAERHDLPFGSADLEGLFLVHTRHLAPYRAFIRTLFRPARAIQPRLDEALRRLRHSRRPLVGMHIRLGDFVDPYGMHGFEHVAPMRSYRRWLERIRDAHGEPVLFIASDAPHIVAPYFADFDTVTAGELGELGLDEPIDLPPTVAQRDTGFFLDWYVLTRCDRLAISNSTFSFTASMMNKGCVEFVRPVFGGRELVPFDPWDSEPLLFHPAYRFVGAELLSRIRWQWGGLGLRRLMQLCRGTPAVYRMFLRQRAGACRFYRGRGGLFRAFADPRFYLMTRRMYDR